MSIIITAAGPPYNVSDRTVTISVHNCSAGTQDKRREERKPRKRGMSLA